MYLYINSFNLLYARTPRRTRDPIPETAKNIIMADAQRPRKQFCAPPVKFAFLSQINSSLLTDLSRHARDKSVIRLPELSAPGQCNNLLTNCILSKQTINMTYICLVKKRCLIRVIKRVLVEQTTRRTRLAPYY